jgi:hypothetical protein
VEFHRIVFYSEAGGWFLVCGRTAALFSTE